MSKELESTPNVPVPFVPSPSKLPQAGADKSETAWTRIRVYLRKAIEESLDVCAYALAQSLIDVLAEVEKYEIP